MAEGRRGLGRGLSALLGEVEAPEAAASVGGPPPEGAREIPIELIRRNPDQPRTIFSEDELAELATSIREKGVLQPILVRPIEGRSGEYQIIAGERRWRAAQRAGLKAVPALVRELDDNQAFESRVLEAELVVGLLRNEPHGQLQVGTVPSASAAGTCQVSSPVLLRVSW